MRSVWLTRDPPATDTPQMPAGVRADKATRRALLAQLLTTVVQAAPGSKLSFTAWASPPSANGGFSADPVAAIAAAANAPLPMAAHDPHVWFTVPDIADIVNSCRVLSELQPLRPVIIVEAGLPDEASAAQVEDALRESHAALWVISQNVDTSGGYSNDYGTASEMPYLLRQGSLGLNAARNLAIASGGLHHVPSKNVSVVTIATLLAAQQLVTYRRPASSSASAKLSVTVSRKDTKVAAPAWPPK